MDSFVKLIKDFKSMKNTHSKLKEENSRLLVERESFKTIMVKNSKMICKLNQFETENSLTEI